MTPRTSYLALMLSGFTALLLLTLGVSDLTSAHRDAERASQRVQQAGHDAQRVLGLRAAAQTVAAGEQPSQDVFQRVNHLLNESGLGHIRIQSVTPAGDQALDNLEGHREQSVRVVLAQIAPPELGVLLKRWQQTQTLWHLHGIDLVAARDRGAQPGTYTATLTASAVYVPVRDAEPQPKEPQP